MHAAAGKLQHFLGRAGPAAHTDRATGPHDLPAAGGAAIDPVALAADAAGTASALRSGGRGLPNTCV